LVGAHAPNVCDIGAMLRIVEIPSARQLIALLAVLTSALPIGLTRNGRIAAVRSPDATRGKYEVDRAQDVHHAMRVVLEPTRMHQEAALGRAPQLGGPADRLLRDTGDLGGPLGHPLAHLLRNGIETDRVLLDEGVIEPVML